MKIFYRLFSCWLITVAVTLLLVQSCTTSKQAANGNGQEGIDQESVLTHIDSVTTDTATIVPAQKAARIKKGQAHTSTVDSLLSTMTLDEKIGQLFFVPAYGYFKNNRDAAYQQLLTQIQQYHIGGLIFFNGNIYGQTVLTNKLQRASEIPLWITQDMEYGAAMRVDGTTRFVPAMGVAATQNPEYARWVGKITAREAKALGVNQIFAPVLDVNNNPKNPVINVRSFSGDPQMVAKYGNQFIDGVQSEGIVSTAKHFPGHGDTDTDSHLSLPVINYDYARLDSVELVPFRSAVGNGINSVMSAHIAFPKLSSESGLPATMDSTVLNRILSDSLNFDGIVVTDGLEMQGIASNFSPGQAVINALKAGVDMMLLSPDELTAINEIKVAVKEGRLTEQRIDKSVRKLLQWKVKQGLFENAQINIDALSANISTREHQLIADEISRKSLTLVKNDKHILPIRPAEYPNITMISVSDGQSGTAGSSMESRMRNYHPNVTNHVLDQRTSEKEKKEIQADVRRSDLLIINSFIYVRSGQKVQLSDEHRSFLKELSSDKPSLLIAFGNPYVVQDLADTDAQLMAWAANGGQVESIVPALFGGSKISGRLPIEIPGMYPIKHGITLPQTTLRTDNPEVAELSRDSLQKVDSIMHRAIFDSTFPGGVVAVIKDGVMAYQESFGYQTYKKLEPVSTNEIYDLASLTKVMATTPAIMKLVDEGKIHLNDTIGKYFSEFSSGPKSKITIRNLLLHTSGLPAFRVYVDSLQSRPEIIKAIKNEPLIYAPGTKYEYSDLGFILLGEIIENVSGQDLDKYLRKNFFYPMSMTSSFFNPRKMGRWLTNRIPPTEIDSIYRKKTIQAEVHDERAYFLDGVAGHAGLFASVRDVATFCQMLLSKGYYGGQKYLESETVESFTHRQSQFANRGYGFDRKSSGFSTAGSLTSDQTFGHTGFTGTSFWVDPKRNMAIIILTNRTYPYRSYGRNINQIRAAIADAIISSIIE